MDISTLTFDDKGLIPAIIQDATSFRVLMLGYMNEESIKKTMASRKVTFYSRSRNELWTKGETSGNFLHLVEMHYDCDSDALLVFAQPNGPTCHTGNVTCFYRDEVASEHPYSFLKSLQELLQLRKEELPEGSYTTHLFNKGLDKIVQKVGEEAVETVIAAKNEDEGEFIYEASDLLFHLMVLLTEKNLSLDTLIVELQKRHKTS